MIATLWVSPFTEIGVGGGLLIGLICLPLLLPFTLAGRPSESELLGRIVLAVLAAAVLGVALWFGCWPLT